MRRLHDQGIGSQDHFVPVYRHPLHQGRLDSTMDNFPAAETPGLTDAEAEYVVDATRRALIS